MPHQIEKMTAIDGVIRTSLAGTYFVNNTKPVNDVRLCKQLSSLKRGVATNIYRMWLILTITQFGDVTVTIEMVAVYVIIGKIVYPGKLTDSNVDILWIS